MEPSSSSVAGVIAWKALGGLAAVIGVMVALAAAVAMCMMTPRSPKEWAVGLISTIAASLGGGALVVLKMGLLPAVLPTEPLQLFMLVSGVGGIMFACGLPGWAVVRWTFTWIEKRHGKDLLEVAADLRESGSKIILP